jgi:hypothetical protein
MSSLAATLPVGTGDFDFCRGARRATRRYNLNADVHIVAPIETDGIVINASAGGLRIAIDAPLEVGATCELKISTTLKTLDERARVVWCRELPDGFLVGLAFEDTH